MLPGLVQRVRHGFAQFWLAFHALHRDALAWKRYLRACTVQAAVTVAIAALFVSTARHSSEGLQEERVRRALEKVNVQTSQPPAAVAPAAPATPALAKATDEDSDEDEDEDSQDSASPAQAPKKAESDFRSGLKELRAKVRELQQQAAGTAVRRDESFQEDRGEADKQFSTLEESAEKLQLSPEETAELAQLGTELGVLEKQTKPRFWDSAWALVLAIYGALSVTQSIVIAFSRDFHAAIARDASLLLGVAPEDPPLTPRVRPNWPWIRRKFRQRTRSLLVFLPGVALISLVAWLLPGRAFFTTVLTSLWAAYWWVVWTASKSARAWEREGVAGPPWFLRLWHQYVSPLPFLGGVARSIERLWMRFTRSVFSPAEAVEAQPAEFVGLAAARALQLIPVVKLYVRPLVPVAAARLLAERSVRAELPAGTAWERAVSLEERAAIPASPGALAARDQM